MIAKLWAQQIILNKKSFYQVPRLLKDEVRQILIDSNYEYLTLE